MMSFRRTVVLWIALTLACCCNGLPSPQSGIEDDEYFANLAATKGAPLITPISPEIILDLASNYTLRCEANEPIVWRWSAKAEPTNATFFTHNPDVPYGNMLYLHEVTASNVGFYYCIKEHSLVDDSVSYDELVEDLKAAKIYVYVNDANHLLVQMEVPILTAMQYEDVTIPCKPTTPQRAVKLITPDQSVHSSETSGRYDPKLGFVVQIQHIHESGTYTCQPEVPSPHNPDEQQSVEVFYSGNEFDDRELAPNCDVFPIKTNNNNRNHTINCTVFASEIPLNLKLNNLNNNNNNNNTLSTSLSPVNNTYSYPLQLQFQPNNTIVSLDSLNNVRDTLMANLVAVISRKSRWSSLSVASLLSSSSAVTSLTTETSISASSRSSSSSDDSDDDDENDDGDDSDDDDGEEGEQDDSDNSDGGGIGDGSNNNLHDKDDDDDSREDVKDDDSSSQKRNRSRHRPRRRKDNRNSDGVGRVGNYGLSSSLSSMSSMFAFTTESGYGVRMGKRDTTNSHRGRLYKSYGSTPRSRTNHVNKPQIFSPSHGHAEEGEEFQLICNVDVPIGVLFEISWETPLDKDPESKDRLIVSKTTINGTTGTHRIGESIITVQKAQKTDAGNYKCFVRDRSNNLAHNTYLMTILKHNESYINISEPNNYYKISTNASKVVQINVKYRGYPPPSLNWYSPENGLIQPSRKYSIDRSSAFITLKINDLELNDTGVYTLKANNGIQEKELKFNVYVRAKPQVYVDDVYVQAGEQARLVCRVIAYPSPKVTWSYTPCAIIPKWPTCDTQSVTFNSTRNIAQGSSEIETIHELIFTPDKPGKVRCTSFNTMGVTIGQATVLMGDLIANMTVYGVDENSMIAKGDEVMMTCAALVYYYSAELDWFKDGERIQTGNGVEVKTSVSDYSYKKAIKFKNIEEVNAGSYECRARAIDSDSEYDSKYLSIVVHEPVAPELTETNLGKPIKQALGESLELVCRSSGIPKPLITWYKDDAKINLDKNNSIEEDNAVFKIRFARPSDEGVYKCEASNRLGVVQVNSQVLITNMPRRLSLTWILFIVALIMVLVFFIIYLFIRVMKARETLRQMKLAGLANFEEGAIEQINPAMSLDEQADLLPYDRRFEFPRDKLKLGKKLGAGAFGVVLKAHAEGILPDEKETVVAVKMVKRTADNEVMKALVSELKIMVHLGQHLNVVNLLGAVTKNIAKREVMVIVEYCRYGNVQNFLLQNRKRFINQVNPITDKIDPLITEHRFSAGDFENHRNSENDPRSGTRAGRPNSSGYLRHSDLYEGHIDSCATEQTVMTTIPEGEDNVMSNNSVQPAWRSNYKSDATECMSVTTSDLVSWAFQVARGMDYLSSRKVLHGDLAARNILLCEDNIVKICDFGLARSMYKSDNYKKQGEAPLPIKWLALESLSDQVFSTYTDVWSFGIVLWEFFSLAKVPYPGMDANQSLYLKLKDGYRMEKPPYANDELYDIMLECWSANPESRPLFHELEKKFARLLGDEVTNHYMDLNEPYLKMNTEYMRQRQTDYLALMGSPDEMAPPPPRYVNGMILPEIRIDTTDDYLQMSPKTGSSIFSPHSTDDYVIPDIMFSEQHSPTISNNLDSPVTKNRKKIGVPPEEIPMLKKSSNGTSLTGSQSDSDTEHSPDPRSIGKTFAQINQTPKEVETSMTINDNSYVNVKPPDLSKKFINSNGTKVAFSNPSYLMFKTVNEGRK